MRSRTCHRITQRPRRASPAFTLVELVVSMAVAGILLTALTSALVLASRALPDAGQPGDKVRQASEITTELAADLQYAQYITERGAHALTFTVADRNSDGCPERIRYAWSATPGDPLTRQYNSGTAVAVLDDVRQFDLTYDLTSVTESYPGPPVEGAEVELGHYTGVTEVKDFGIDQNHSIGQYLQPPATIVPVNAISWSVTRAQFQAKKNDFFSRELHAQIRSANADSTPTTTILGDQTFNQISLNWPSYNWKEVTFSTVTGLSPGAGVCLVVTRDVSSYAAKIAYDNKGGSNRVSTTNGGGSWTVDADKSMQYYLYGKVTMPGPTQTAVRQYATGVRLALQTGTGTDARLDTAIRLLNTPEVLAAVWEASFDSNPTALDITVDGVGDWARRDAQPFDSATLISGVWHADATLDTKPNNDFTQLTTVDVRFRNTSVGGNGAVFWINADWSGGTFAPLFAYLQLQADGTQTLGVYDKLNDATPVLLKSLPGLSSDFVNLRLVIDPSLNTVNIKVNGNDKGTFSYTTYTQTNSDRFATVLPWGSAAEFDYVRVRVRGN